MQSALPSKKGWIVALGILAVVIFIGETQAPTSLAADRTVISAVTNMLILATPAIAVGALTGRGGILSLGHSFFFLVGAFAATLWAEDISLFGWHPDGLWSFILAAFFGALARAAGSSSKICRWPEAMCSWASTTQRRSSLGSRLSYSADICVPSEGAPWAPFAMIRSRRRVWDFGLWPAARSSSLSPVH
jgi:hypothetical protein